MLNYPGLQKKIQKQTIEATKTVYLEIPVMDDDVAEFLSKIPDDTDHWDCVETFTREQAPQYSPQH